MRTFVPLKVTPAVFKEIKHMLRQRKWLHTTYEEISLCKNIGLTTIRLVNRSANYQQYIVNVRKGKMNYGLNPSDKLLSILLIAAFTLFWLGAAAMFSK